MPKFSPQAWNSKLILGLILILGLVVRVLSLQGESFWLDEAYSFYEARNPFLLATPNAFGLITLTQRLTFLRFILSDDIHPPFYYAQLGLWSLLDTSDGWMRLNSIFWGMATIPAVYCLAQRCFPHSVIPVLAASLVAFSPFHVEMSIELRMYGLMACLAALSIYALHPILHQPNATWKETGKDWILYTLSNLLIVYSQGIGFLWLVIQGLIYGGCLLQGRWQKQELPRSFKPWLCSQLVVIAAFLPWALLMVRGSRIRGASYLKVPTLQDLLSVPGHLLFNNAASFSYPSPPLSTPDPLLIGLFVLALLLSAIGLFSLRQRFTDLLLLGVPSVGGLLIFFVISIVARPIFIVRALSFALPFFAILLSLGLVIVGQGLAQRFSQHSEGPKLQSQVAIATVLMLLLSINSFGIYQGITTPNRTQWREASAVLAQHLQPNDTVIVPQSSAGEFLLYNSVPRSHYNGVLVETLRLYWREKPAFLKQVKQDYEQFLHSHQLDFQKNAHLLLLTEDLEELNRLRPANSRVWLVTSPGRTGAELDKLLASLRQTKSMRAQYDFFRATLTLYE